MTNSLQSYKHIHRQLDIVASGATNSDVEMFFCSNSYRHHNQPQK